MQPGDLPGRAAICSGSLEAAKWLAVIFMTVDHVDAFLFSRQLHWASDVGRLAMPMFAAVLGHNLAHLLYDKHLQLIQRMLIAGGVSTFPYALLSLETTGAPPLNILFAFAASVFVSALLLRGRRVSALCFFMIAGVLVEYAWFGMAIVLAFRLLSQKPTIATCWLAATSVFLLAVVNLNHWAMASLPLLLLLGFISPAIPRLRHFLYFYYPAHLFVLLAIGSWGT